MTDNQVIVLTDYFNQLDASQPLIKNENRPILDNNQPSGQPFSQPVYRRIMPVVWSVFMGYAILLTFQHYLKQMMNISDNDRNRSLIFSNGVSMIYFGNLIMRIGHNLLFGCWSSRIRVYISMVCMIISISIVGLIFLQLDHLVLIYLAYLLGGIAIGSFESNLLSTITLLGSSTKFWAIIGIPIGFATIQIGGFALVGLGISAFYVYLTVWLSLIVGLVIFAWFVPSDGSANFDRHLVRNWLVQIGQIRHWLPLIWTNSLTLIVDMFCLSMTGIMLYIFDGEMVPCIPHDRWLIPNYWYFMILYTSSMVGDAIGRKIAYSIPVKWVRWPAIYLTVSVTGLVLCLSQIGLATLVGIFLIMLANGIIYGLTIRAIDLRASYQYNLMSLSVWLFVGDFGSVIGSNVIQLVREEVCNWHYNQSQYVCQVQRS